MPLSPRLYRGATPKRNMEGRGALDGPSKRRLRRTDTRPPTDFAYVIKRLRAHKTAPPLALRDLFAAAFDDSPPRVVAAVDKLGMHAGERFMAAMQRSPGSQWNFTDDMEQLPHLTPLHVLAACGAAASVTVVMVDTPYALRSARRVMDGLCIRSPCGMNPVMMALWMGCVSTAKALLHGYATAVATGTVQSCTAALVRSESGAVGNLYFQLAKNDCGDLAEIIQLLGDDTGLCDHEAMRSVPIDLALPTANLAGIPQTRSAYRSDEVEPIFYALHNHKFGFVEGYILYARSCSLATCDRLLKVCDKDGWTLVETLIATSKRNEESERAALHALMLIWGKFRDMALHYDTVRSPLHVALVTGTPAVVSACLEVIGTQLRTELAVIRPQDIVAGVSLDRAPLGVDLLRSGCGVAHETLVPVLSMALASSEDDASVGSWKARAILEFLRRRTNISTVYTDTMLIQPEEREYHVMQLVQLELLKSDNASLSLGELCALAGNNRALAACLDFLDSLPDHRFMSSNQKTQFRQAVAVSPRRIVVLALLHQRTSAVLELLCERRPLWIADAMRDPELRAIASMVPGSGLRAICESLYDLDDPSTTHTIKLMAHASFRARTSLDDGRGARFLSHVMHGLHEMIVHGPEPYADHLTEMRVRVTTLPHQPHQVLSGNGIECWHEVRHRATRADNISAVNHIQAPTDDAQDSADASVVTYQLDIVWACLLTDPSRMSALKPLGHALNRTLWCGACSHGADPHGAHRVTDVHAATHLTAVALALDTKTIRPSHVRTRLDASDGRQRVDVLRSLATMLDRDGWPSDCHHELWLDAVRRGDTLLGERSCLPGHDPMHIHGIAGEAVGVLLYYAIHGTRPLRPHHAWLPYKTLRAALRPETLARGLPHLLMLTTGRFTDDAAIAHLQRMFHVRYVGHEAVVLRGDRLERHTGPIWVDGSMEQLAQAAVDIVSDTRARSVQPLSIRGRTAVGTGVPVAVLTTVSESLLERAFGARMSTAIEPEGAEQRFAYLCAGSLVPAVTQLRSQSTVDIDALCKLGSVAVQLMARDTGLKMAPGTTIAPHLFATMVGMGYPPPQRMHDESPGGENRRIVRRYFAMLDPLHARELEAMTLESLRESMMGERVYLRDAAIPPLGPGVPEVCYVPDAYQGVEVKDHATLREYKDCYIWHRLYGPFLAEFQHIECGVRGLPDIARDYMRGALDPQAILDLGCRVPPATMADANFMITLVECAPGDDKASFRPRAARILQALIDWTRAEPARTQFLFQFWTGRAVCGGVMNLHVSCANAPDDWQPTKDCPSWSPPKPMFVNTCYNQLHVWHGLDTQSFMCALDQCMEHGLDGDVYDDLRPRRERGAEGSVSTAGTADPDDSANAHGPRGPSDAPDHPDLPDPPDLPDLPGLSDGVDDDFASGTLTLAIPLGGDDTSDSGED